MPALRPPTTPTSPNSKSRNNGTSSIRRRTRDFRNKVGLPHSCHRLLHQQLSGLSASERRNTRHQNKHEVPSSESISKQDTVGH
jgi:hypothetical protein